MDKRTAEWGMVAGLMEAQSDSEPPPVEYRTDPRCHVCSAPDCDLPNGRAVRNLIDEMLLVPKSYAAVLRLIEPLMESWPEDARISRHSLMRHSRNHLAWEQAAVRKIAERRAKEAGKADEAAGRMLTAETVLAVIQQFGFEAVVSGAVTPSVKDTLAASATLREIERETEGKYSTAYLLSQLDRHIQVMREVVPQEYHEEILRRLEAEPPTPMLASSPDPAWDEIVDEMGGDAFK